MMKFIILFPFKHTNIVLFHLLLNFIFACIIYSKLKPYYDPELNKIHIKYPEFRRLDKLSFIRLWIGLSTVFWPRALFFLFLLAFMAFTLNIGKISKYKCIKDLIFSYGCRFVLVSLGCIIPHKIRYDNKSKEIYKKYLGPDYEINYNKKFSTIVTNHVSWVESFYYSYLYACGYISKLSAKFLPFVGKMAIYSKTIFCDRHNPQSRALAASEIEQRQKGIFNGTNKTQLAIYPEGTATNGTHLIKFKRGAFMTCLPIKPIVEIIDQSEDCTLATGILPLKYHLILASCYLYHNVKFLELPVLEPTEFMYETYKNFGKEKWMIFMNVTKRIMSEISGLKMSEKSFAEKLQYTAEVTGNKIKGS